MKTIVLTSLGGGQGKSTSSYMLSRLLARNGARVLAIDGNPQADLSLYLRSEAEEDDPTLLELLKNQLKDPLDAVYTTPYENLFIIPCDRMLSEAKPYLASSGSAATVLKIRLEPFHEHFDYAVIDIQPTSSELSITCVGAGDYFILPCEANTKGHASGIDTFQFLEELAALRVWSGEILGIVPFREKWAGRNLTIKSRDALEMLQSLAEDHKVELLPSIRESDQFEAALKAGILLDELDSKYAELQYPFEKIVEKLGVKNVGSSRAA